jgi:NAD-dependent SIR2 family protein deacetylase
MVLQTGKCEKCKLVLYWEKRKRQVYNKKACPECGQKLELLSGEEDVTSEYVYYSHSYAKQKMCRKPIQRDGEIIV